MMKLTCYTKSLKSQIIGVQLASRKTQNDDKMMVELFTHLNLAAGRLTGVL